MAGAFLEQNLLVGVVAFRDGVIDAEKLDYVCRLAAVCRADVMDTLRGRSWIDAAKEAELQAAVRRLVGEHDGNVPSALRAFMGDPAGRVLDAIEDPRVRQILAATGWQAERVDPSAFALPTKDEPSVTSAPAKERKAVAQARRRPRSLASWKRIAVVAVPLVLAAAILGYLHRQRSAADAALMASLDQHVAQVRPLLASSLTLQETRSGARRDVLRRELDSFAKIAATPGTRAAARAARGRAHAWMAQIQLALESPGEATTLAGKALDELEPLAADAPYRACFAEALVAKGRAFDFAKQPLEAIKALQSAREQYAALVKDFPDRVEYETAYADMLLELMDLNARGRNDWAIGGMGADRARALLQKLAAANGETLEYRQKVAAALYLQYIGWRGIGAPVAEEAFRGCCSLAAKLASEHRDVPACQYTWARVLWSMDDHLLRAVEAEKHREIPWIGSAFAGVSNVPNLGGFMSEQLALVRARQINGITKSCKRRLDEGLRLARRLTEAQPDVPAYQVPLAQFEITLAQYEALLGRSRKAVEQIEQVLKRPQQAIVLVNAAEVYARWGAARPPSIPAAEWPRLRDDCAKRAIELLTKAIRSGYIVDTRRLISTREYGWLADRSDFWALSQIHSP
jgi:tetratricopeptide (TPR) repeat protein